MTKKIKSKKKYKHPTDFKTRVWAIVQAIPKGKTLTYKEVAKRAGNPNASRAVGALLKTNYDPAIPCHRVIRSDGSLGGYNRGAKEKKRILREEAVRFSAKNA